ncbi:MAG TPA: oligosaccharide flippase family protein [Bryobacteraceae bacterium]|nr:oligosaccharide flippase family protein [Bryobacteraceae bacterium]
MTPGAPPQAAPPRRVREPGVSLGRNAIANVAGFSVHLTIAFFLAPFVLRSLGDARYGVWSLAAELVGYYSLLDLGLRSAVSYFIAHYTARREHDRLNASVCSAFWLLLGIGVMVGVGGSGLALLFPRLFVRGQTDPREVVVAIMITSVMVGLGLAMELFSAVLTGCRRLDLVNLTEVMHRVVLAIGMYVALTAGGGLIAISLVQAGGRVLTWSINYRQAQRVSGGFSLHPSRFQWEELRALGSIGSLNIAITLSQAVMARTDLIIVGAFVGLRAVAFYNIARLLVDYAAQVTSNLTMAFRPHLTHLHSEGDMPGMRRMYLFGSRISGLISFPLAACMFTFGPAFISLWVGPKYVSGPVGQRTDVILTVLLLGATLRWQQSMSYQALFATGRYGVLTSLTAVQAALTVGLSLILVRFYGAAGVAAGSMVPALLMNGIAVPLHTLRRCTISVRQYLRDGAGRSIIVALLVFGFGQTIIRTWYPDSWGAFFAQAAAVVLATAGLGFSLGLMAEDRRLAITRLRRIRARLLGGS